MPAIYNLHKRHGQFSGFQHLIFDLKIFRIFNGTCQKFPYFWAQKRYCF